MLHSKKSSLSNPIDKPNFHLIETNIRLHPIYKWSPSSAPSILSFLPNELQAECRQMRSREIKASATRVFNFRVETLQRRTPKRRGKATHPYLLLRESMESSFHSCLLMKIERSRERGEEGRVPLTRAQSVRNRKKLPWNAFNARQSRIKYSSSPLSMHFQLRVDQKFPMHS